MQHEFIWKVWLYEWLFSYFSRQKNSSSASHDRKKTTISVALHNCNQQRNLRGEVERRVRDPVTNSFPKSDFSSNILQESDFTGDCMNSTSSILLCSYTNALTQKQITLLWIKIGVLHLGEELGLWGMLGPPCGVCMPWQLSVTSRQMIAVLPDPALPTITAPRPSQLLVFCRTSSRRVKSQSRPTKGVSAVMPGTSNNSGLSMMSACLNCTNLPGQSERSELKLFKNIWLYVI